MASNACTCCNPEDEKVKCPFEVIAWQLFWSARVSSCFLKFGELANGKL